ncbi:hypothetical protein CEUSTIGMA_g11987.t1 [Chlamydomonas eustigma]|uniref:C2 domain-containing protein n=1 Tax=Chlamydomonas eustigma TaxID=1157962 RepID=A0A250XNH4_9CHLO|nr:hypothetical protein CEUSTIGMA_g11987.t1 [Chlamydomonas eustigma]|eukprot:GAX84566.1 hypothetical protein CEUSTIGMA_g11987.t1 [Chlamydomonas eustigma]
MSGGKLCCSVIEARNVLAADTTSELSFYVKLRLGHNEVKTDTCFKNITPKFLKDVRLSVPVPEFAVLRVELLQLGTRGDLVVGSAEIRVLSLINKGTVVQWLDLHAFNQSIGAQLCCVLRYLSAEANRPMTPSYAIVTREAREKAVIVAAAGEHVQAPPVARSLFSDETHSPHRATSSPNTPAATNPAPSSNTLETKTIPEDISPNLHYIDSKQLLISSTAPEQGAPSSSTSQASLHYASSCSLSDYHLSAVAVYPQHNILSKSHSPDGTTTLARGKFITKEPSRSHTSSTSLAQSSVLLGLEYQQKPDKGVNRHHRRIPLPLAVASGALLGALLYMLKRQARLQKAGQDDLCLLSSCFNKENYEQYRNRIRALEK